MDQDRVIELKRQRQQGMQAQQEIDILEPRLQAIKNEVLHALESETISDASLMRAHAMIRLTVELTKQLKSEITSGKVAEKELEMYGDV